MIALIVAIASTLSRGTLNLVLTNYYRGSCGSGGSGGSGRGGGGGCGGANLTHQWARLAHPLTQPKSQTFAQSYRPRYSNSTKKFKRPKNREDGSDLDENLTESIATQKTLI